jgi:hypothetical protein
MIYFTCGHNSLTGSIASSYGSMNYLKAFYVTDNAFTGTIPIAMYRKHYLTLFAVAENHFSGTIPEDIKDLEQVQNFEIYHNHFTGTLPDGFSYLYYLQTVLLHFNSFSGNLNALGPRNGTFSYLSKIDLSKNKFTGKLPFEAFILPSLSSFAAVENCMSGSISVMNYISVDELNSKTEVTQSILETYTR